MPALLPGRYGLVRSLWRWRSGLTCAVRRLRIGTTSQPRHVADTGLGDRTRFFFAPDIDLGTPVDTRFFVKSGHQRGIRVVLDIVMNFFSTTCPLGVLALDRFSVPGGTDGRNDFAQKLFSVQYTVGRRLLRGTRLPVPDG